MTQRSVPVLGSLEDCLGTDLYMNAVARMIRRTAKSKELYPVSSQNHQERLRGVGDRDYRRVSPRAGLVDEDAIVWLELCPLLSSPVPPLLRLL